MATRAQPLRQHRFAVLPLLARPRVVRLTVTLGSVLVTVGLYVPSAGRILLMHGAPVHCPPMARSCDTWVIADAVGARFAPLYVAPLSLPAQLGVDVVYSVLTLGGLALIPLLWQPLAPKGAAAVRWTYAVWLVLLTLLAVAGLPAWWQFMAHPPDGAPPGMFTVAASYLVPGAVVFPLGVLVSGAALLLLLREPPPTAAPAASPRTRWRWTATLVLTAGALLWGIGFYMMPEAVTTACPPVSFSLTQFVQGACAGLDSDQVRHAAYSAGLAPIALFFYRVSWNFELLVAAAGITTLGGWTRQLSVSTLAWLTVWPVLALGGALVALHGAGLVAQHGFALTATTRTWRVGPGMIVTFVGIGLVMLGQVGLWREVVRELARRRGSASS